jgi:uncharacterized protein DUF5069
MIDKIRLRAKGELPSNYHANFGKGFDEKCVKFLPVNYDEVVERVKQGGRPEEILDCALKMGSDPMKTIFTCGTNSCASAAGTMKSPKYWNAPKKKQG